MRTVDYRCQVTLNPSSVRITIFIIMIAATSTKYNKFCCCYIQVLYRLHFTSRREKDDIHSQSVIWGQESEIRIPRLTMAILVTSDLNQSLGRDFKVNHQITICFHTILKNKCYLLIREPRWDILTLASCTNACPEKRVCVRVVSPGLFVSWWLRTCRYTHIHMFIVIGVRSQCSA